MNFGPAFFTRLGFAPENNTYTTESYFILSLSYGETSASWPKNGRRE